MLDSRGDRFGRVARAGASFGVLCLGFLVGCEPPDTAMLHRMVGYSGTLKLTRAGAATVQCDLAFHRHNGNFQIKLTEQDAVVSLVRGKDGVRAFAAGAVREPTPQERSRFLLVQSVVEADGIEGVRPGPQTYEVRTGGVWYTVQLESQRETAIHGQPR